ncbi:MAG: DNA double-strand break repair nuclease NurA [Candidatus Hodarchaeota archaeon]
MTIRDNSVKLKNHTFNFGHNKNPVKDKIGLTKEQLLINDLRNIAEEYLEIEKIKENFVNILLKNIQVLDFSEFIPYPNYNIKEKFIKKEIKSSNIRGLKVVSIDGSSVLKKFMNVDFSFLKAIAVKYYFYKNDSSKIDYFPDISGFNNYYVKGNFVNCEESAIEAKVSMDLRFMEIKLLNDLIEAKPDIDFIIIDGSIVIMPINLIFAKDPEITKKYDELLKEYRRLYTNCDEKGIILIGSIKDTRTSALSHLIRDSILLLKPNEKELSDFTKINYRQIIEYFSDLDLYNRILRKSERSCIFNCKKEVDKIRDTGIKKEIPYYFPLSFYGFYLKTVIYDTPCRIEFFMDEKHSIEDATKKADLISSILLPISSYNDFYGLPIPQIEAHKRAVFKPFEINLLFNNLTRTLNKYGIQLFEKRRMRRPF